MMDRRPSLGTMLGAALLPSLAAVAATLAVLGRETWARPELPFALLLAVAAAGVVAAALAVPALRRLREREAKLSALSARLAEMEARSEEALVADPVSLLDTLEPPAPPRDERLEEALAELEAAMQDEERLRERRNAAENDVRETLRAGRAWAESSNAGGSGLERLPDLLERLGESTEEVRRASDAVLQIAAAGDEVAGLVEKHARTGQESGARATRGASDLEARVGIIDKLVRRLAARSREIGQILVVLNDITEQTNLLALNAGIIAAQAGSHGKGFGVVADEMRNLSERASSSTKETELLAQTLQDDVSQAIRAMEEAAEDVRSLRETLAESGERAAVLADLGEKGAENAAATRTNAERGAAALRDLGHRVARAVGERESLGRIRDDVLAPSRKILGDCIDRLESQWQAGALRETLRTRLGTAIAAVRERRGHDRNERRRFEERLRAVRESGRLWAHDLEEGRRRDHLVAEVGRDIRELASPPTDL